MTKLPFDRLMVIRTVILFAAWANQLLIVNGYSPLPFDDAGIEQGVSAGITFVASVWSWWSNNAITRKARQVEVIAEDKGLK